MNLRDVFPPAGHVQDLYCDSCEGHLDLAFADFHECVSGVDISIKGLPVLRCDKCPKDYLPDGSRFAIIEHHRMASEKGKTAVRVQPYLHTAATEWIIARPWTSFSRKDARSHVAKGLLRLGKAAAQKNCFANATAN